MMYQNTSWNGNNVNIQLPDINWAEIEKLKNRDWLGELKHSQELALKGLENVAKLKDNKYLKEQMDTDCLLYTSPPSQSEVHYFS